MRGYSGKIAGDRWSKTRGRLRREATHVGCFSVGKRRSFLKEGITKAVPWGLDRLLRRIGVEIVPFDAGELIDARIVFRRFGEGGDFARTDVRNARLEAI